MATGCKIPVRPVPKEAKKARPTGPFRQYMTTLALAGPEHSIKSLFLNIFLQHVHHERETHESRNRRTLLPQTRSKNGVRSSAV